jgi:hypothetical protein|tara:strand:- start:5191 stop:5565 length:375 start_codon:yes stop_codon:yes gene_type:complete
MPKVKLTQIANNYEVSFDEALQILQEKVPAEYITGKGKNTWLSEEGQSIVEDGLFIDEIIPHNYIGKVLSECPNPRYNYVYSKEISKRVPVMIPRRWQGQMVGKNITFEAIEDESGVSYRYVKA